MTEVEIKIKPVSSLDDLAKVFFVRGCVFVEELQVPYQQEFDDSDQSAMHILGLIDAEPVAACRVRPVGGIARVERICVRKSYRGKGLGDSLLSSALSLIHAAGYSECDVLAEGMLVKWFRNHQFEIRDQVKRKDSSECYRMHRIFGKPNEQSSLPVTEQLAEISSQLPVAETSSVIPPKTDASIHTCTVSGSKFEITESDLDYYAKMDVPAPKLSPDERARRRMSFANQRNLFVRNCAGTGKRIVTNYPPECNVPIYDNEYWYSDHWDKFAVGRDFDFNRPLFEQFGELLEVAPRPNLQRAAALDENSDYTNYAGENKNCYLIFDSDKNWDCYHSYSINSCRDVIDCFRVEKCELCYECVDCTNCYDSIFLQNCDNCSESAFLKNCIGCANCFGSVNLRNKQYYFMNEKCSEKDYRKKLENLHLNRHSKLKSIRPKFVEHSKQFPHKNLEGVHNENIIGDYLTNCKNALDCFDSRNLWDCKYITQAFDEANDCMDCTEIGYGAELLYECSYVGYTARNNRLCTHALGNNSNLTYCYYCPYCSDCFACAGLHHTRYAILNKPYSESEYKQLVPRIIDHMKKTGEWGEFFPPQISPFPYNLTHAHEFYPLTKAQATQLGYRWRDEEKREYQPASYTIPDAISDVQDDILEAVLSCSVTGKNYKIQKPELALYCKMKLPIPRLSPDERHLKRLKLRNGRTLYQRKCAASGREITSSIPPSNPVEVLSEDEFLKRLD